ncbi:MAG: multidrug effflux MFS transporter [Hoeflea sp.]|uniref:multidrug effflux MFS transporter n=1 Tax=Hoeflea sp. TaxID=1940281 RepID=UPI001D5FD318|nr:multidrug effflux MFS transporter [Hoeflea sp.]MBU4530401.1 multidrug effflux MFS transporter [Alphaproteobacteria bacterium]MBU4545188.1 multidrug effflux MFS transporter [Alphaproteobacteria bacterium]MBU4549612.1 multidrug effflux MFS transporter [Alphaproteobacteria bacterium]MBV1721991.1 multidrug effflux MFS transporter [Hoeflea sp.]MBV1761341.1 multidrug effflux MFS transporter [Hoeflea sp.]
MHGTTPPVAHQPVTIGGVSRPQFIAIVASLMALNALAIDIMLPAFPNISQSLGLTDANLVQYVLLSYVIGFGGAQLFFGPIADRYGRRTPLFVGIALYAICAIAGAFAPSFEFLLLARFLQGVGAAATRVIALSVVRDTHSGRGMAATMSLVMMVFMVVPVFAPMMGQVIILAGDWHLIFVFMAFVSVAVGLWAAFRLPETLKEENRRPLTLASIRQAFAIVLTNRMALFYTLATSFYFGSLFGFLNVAQPIYVDIYGLGSYFPVAFAAVAVVMAGSSFLNSRLVGRFGQRRLSHSALIAYFVLGLILAGLTAMGPIPFWLFFSISLLMMPLFGFVGSNFNSIAMEPLGAIAGTASSTLGFAQTVGGGVVGALIGQAYDGTVFPLAAGYALVSAVAIAMVLIAEKGRLFGVGTPD